MARHHHQQISIPAPPERVAQRVEQLLRQLPKVSSVWVNPPVITANTGVSMASWGETITVHIGHTSDGSVVDVHSKCAMPLQLVDFGRNRKNVDHVVSALLGP